MIIKLTKKELEDAEPGVIRSGFHPRVGVWVAVRGGIPDWTVYALNDGVFKLGTTMAEKIEHVMAHGHKVYRDHALSLVDADKEAAGRFRE